MTTYYGLKMKDIDVRVWGEPLLSSISLTLQDVIEIRDKYCQKSFGDLDVVRITVSPIADADIVRCPNERGCKDGLSCPHGPIHERNRTCEKPKYTGCPGCVAAGKGDG